MPLFEKITGFKIDQKETIKILTNLGFEVKKQKKIFLLTVPTWRPDILQEVDIVEELVRIKGYDQIKMIEPEKVRNKDTLNKIQKLFHFFTKSYCIKRILGSYYMVFY